MSVTIRDAMTDPALFGGQFGDNSFRAWRALLAGFYGLPLVDGELYLWREITGRKEAPTSAAEELWLAVGRRGGKSQCAALLAVFEAAFHDYRDRLSPGEVATIMVLAADRRQARSVFRYITGLLHSNPMTEQMIVREDKETVELSNRTAIEVHTASFRAVRGYTVACCIADEIAFWRSEDSANPDHEIINAIRPAMATLGGKLVALSSPYSRRGALWDAHKRYYGKPGDILVAQAPSRTMNPKLPERVVKLAYERDPATASAEYGAQFRTDIEAFITREAVEACTIPGRIELPPMSGTHYIAFTDPAGGSGQDAFTLCIAHKEEGVAVVDAIRSRKPPFSPEQTIAEFAALLDQYRIRTVTGDRYGGEFPRELFRNCGITYEIADRPRSDLYRDLLPLMNSGRVEIPEHATLLKELVNLERRTARSGKDTIDHGPGGHDDVANSVAGVIVTLGLTKQRIPIRDWL